MIGAILCGLAVGCVYTWFLVKNIRIKMPAGVPACVANAFTALVPGDAIITVASVFHGVTSTVLDTTLVESIYTAIQIPLQGLTDSLPGALICTFLISFLWFFGVHGSTIVLRKMTMKTGKSLWTVTISCYNFQKYRNGLKASEQ